MINNIITLNIRIIIVAPDVILECVFVTWSFKFAIYNNVYNTVDTKTRINEWNQ